MENELNRHNLISIIIPAYNSSKTVKKTLDAVLHQTYSGPKEIIVVDDGSTDDTPKIVKSLNEVVYIFQNNAGPASARNTGFYNSAGKILFFTDADCIPHNDWIDKALLFFQNPRINIVAGSYGIANPNQILSKCIHSEIIFRHKRLSHRTTKVFGSYNFAIKREVFEEMKGFDIGYKSASGEDNDLSYRIMTAGYHIQFIPDMQVDHYHPSKVGKYLREQYNHGFWRAKIYYDHPHMTQGDEYTFWKDIMETGFIVTFLVSLLTTLMGFTNIRFLTTLIFMLLLFEFFYGIWMIRSFLLGCYFGLVMFLRAYVRAIGFLHGLIIFLPRKTRF